MASTYEPIATTTLGSAASSVTFSSISGSYTDLIIVCSAKLATSTGNFYIQCGNGSIDTGSNYSSIALYGTGSAAGSYKNSSQTQTTTGELDASNFDIVIININNYANTATYKTVLTRNSSQTVPRASSWAGLWRSTSAIDTIKLFNDAQNIASGSTFTLYGIKAA